MKIKFLLLCSLFISFFHSFCDVKKENPQVIMETDLGNIIIELYANKAPITCANFLEYIDKNLFTGAKFYRVVRKDNQPNNNIKIEVVQWGLYLDDDEYLLPPILHETTKETGILHKNGIISMARNETGTASSEFFICIGDQPELDYGGKRNPDMQGFAAFGKVIKGMDVIREIQQLPDTGQFLINQVRIWSIKRL